MNIGEFLDAHQDLLWIAPPYFGEEQLGYLSSSNAIPTEDYKRWLQENVPKWLSARARAEGPQLLAEYRIGDGVNWENFGRFHPELEPLRWPTLRSYLEQYHDEKLYQFIRDQPVVATGAEWIANWKDNLSHYSSELDAPVTVISRGMLRQVFGTYQPAEDDGFTRDSYMLIIDSHPVWRKLGATRNKQRRTANTLYRMVELPPSEDDLQFYVQPFDYIAKLTGKPTVAEAKPSYDPKDVVKAFRCSECDHVSQETAEGPLYECGDCGTKFTKSNSEYGNHRCECGKFASKLAEEACSECEAGEVEEVDAIEKDGELIAVEDL